MTTIPSTLMGLAAPQGAGADMGDLGEGDGQDVFAAALAALTQSPVNVADQDIPVATAGQVEADHQATDHGQVLLDAATTTSPQQPGAHPASTPLGAHLSGPAITPGADQTTAAATGTAPPPPALAAHTVPVPPTSQEGDGNVGGTPPAPPQVASPAPTTTLGAPAPTHTPAPATPTADNHDVDTNQAHPTPAPTASVPSALAAPRPVQALEPAQSPPSTSVAALAPAAATHTDAPTAVQAATPAPVTSGAPQVANLSDQLTPRITALRNAGPGQHVLTVRVDPETFGPVRVVAHISAEGMRIDLVGGTEQAREALRQALPDLRRDLAGSGLQAELNLGPDTDSGPGHQFDQHATPPSPTNGTTPRGPQPNDPSPHTSPTPTGGGGGLDVTV